MFIKTSFLAGEIKEFREVGNFFRLMESERDVTVIYYALGAEIARAENVKGGYAETFTQEFDGVKIISATGQNIQCVIRLSSRVSYDTPPVGNVNIVSNSGLVNQFVADVDSGSDTQLLAENRSRKYLLVQNLSESQAVFISFSGVVVVGAGIKLFPGAVFTAESYCMSNELRAISGTDGAQVLVLEG